MHPLSAWQGVTYSIRSALPLRSQCLALKTATKLHLHHFKTQLNCHHRTASFRVFWDVSYIQMTGVERSVFQQLRSRSEVSSDGIHRPAQSYFVPNSRRNKLDLVQVWVNCPGWADCCTVKRLLNLNGFKITLLTAALLNSYKPQLVSALHVWVVSKQRLVYATFSFVALKILDRSTYVSN